MTDQQVDRVVNALVAIAIAIFVTQPLELLPLAIAVGIKAVGSLSIYGCIVTAMQWTDKDY